MDNSNCFSNVGKLARKRRVEHGYSIESLAEKAGLNHTTVSNLENGYTFRIDTLVKIADALECPLGLFFAPNELRAWVETVSKFTDPSDEFKEYQRLFKEWIY